MGHERIYIFTEGGSSCGFGHITRCHALYEEIRERGYPVELIVNNDQSHLKLSNIQYIKCQWDRCLEQFWLEGNLAIVDSYLADLDTYEQISQRSERALYIDDFNRLNYPAGVVVNPGVGAKQLSYMRGNDQTFLLGLDYVILRRAFRETFKLGHKVARRKVQDVLVILGGSDILNLSPRVVGLLRNNFQEMKIHLVIGKGSCRNSEIEMNSDQGLFCYHDLEATQLCELMQKCDIAVTAAGQTVYELIAVQTPFVCIKVVNNQENNVKGLMSEQLIEDYFDASVPYKDSDFGKWLLKSLQDFARVGCREMMIEKMRKYHLQDGVKRIISALVGE